MRFHLRRVFTMLLAVSVILFFVGHMQPPSPAKTAVLLDDHSAQKQAVITKPHAAVVVVVAAAKEGHVHLFPHGDETNDRILEQLNMTVLPRRKTYTILASHSSQADSGNKIFLKHTCPYTNCFITNNISHMTTADAILLHNSVPSSVVKNRPTNPDQVRILYILESPYHSSSLLGVNDVINWTATYRRDSVLNAPYERFTPFPNTPIPDKPTRNYAAHKTKMAAWFVSNCNSRNGRAKYVAELQKYIDVDIYGACGNLKCPRKNNKQCFQYLNKDYRFYLSFENSNCKDYITEKFFVNGLQNDVIPVVMGAHPEDYRRAAPPNSYIHVDDFDSPRQLADYLHKLASDDALYNDYFRWKGTGEFINTKFWCRLCNMLNTVPEQRIWYDSVSNWWRGPGVCQTPSKHPWATWKRKERSLDFINTVKYG